MWEIFTCGKMPYGRLKNTEVVDRVQRGIILEKPKMCFKEVYEVILRLMCAFKPYGIKCTIYNVDINTCVLHRSCGNAGVIVLRTVLRLDCLKNN